MLDPKIVLEILSKNNSKVDNIYKYLLNPELYKIAYQNIYSKPSQMTPASDGSTIDGMSMERIEKLIDKLRNKTYQPTPLRRVNVPKKNGKIRPISIPSFEDKLVQEAIRMLLEAIYEHTFSEHSHGFRPQKSCHTALYYMKGKFKGTKWWIDCDIKGCFDNINHHILLITLAKRIKEQKFLNLINLFLKAGYIENWKYHKTYSGTPQGSIISPILANIYLHNFDKFIEEIIKDFEKGKQRKQLKEYHNLINRIHNTKKRLQKGIEIEKNKKRLTKQREEFRKQKNRIQQYDQFDPNFRRLSYVRYADDFLIGVIASKKEAEEIKNRIQEFLRNELKLELNEEKTKIVHNSELVRFLGYDVGVNNDRTKPEINGKIGLWLPYDICKNFILDNRFGKFVCDAQTGKPKLKAIYRAEMINNDELEILKIYNSKIRGLYNYYKMASNVCKLNGFGYICEISFFRTLAAKYSTSCRKLFRNKNYSKRENKRTVVGITYNNKFYPYFNGPFTIEDKINHDKNIDIIENINKYFVRTSLIKRLEANKCELCGDEEGPFEVHHIKKLKDLKGKSFLERFMISRNRKTLVLCCNCHYKIHAGKL